MKKYQKIILGTSLVTLTLVPTLAISLTSCSNDMNKVNNKLPKESQDLNKISCSTTANSINELVSQVKNSRNMDNLKNTLSPENILNTLKLKKDQATIEYQVINQSKVLFSIELNRNYTFSNQVLTKKLEGVTLNDNSISFNINLSKNFLDNISFVILSNLDLNNILSSLENVKKKNELNSIENNLIKNNKNIKSSVSEGIVLVKDNHKFMTANLTLEITNDSQFSPFQIDNLINKYSNKDLDITLSKNGKILKISNILTKIIVTSNTITNISLNPINLKKILDSLESVFTIDQFNKLANSSKIKEELIKDSQLSNAINVDFVLNKEATITNGYNTYTLRIEPINNAYKINNPSTDIKNLVIKNQFGALVINNIPTSIYTKTVNIGNISSFIFNKPNSISDLISEINEENKGNSLLEKINKSLDIKNKITSDCKFVMCNENSNNSSVSIIFANKDKKEFQCINVIFVIPNISSIFKITNQTSQLNTLVNLKKSSCLVNNAILAKENIPTSDFAKLKGDLVTSNSVDKEKYLDPILNKLFTNPNFESNLKNQIEYNFYQDILKLANKFKIQKLDNTNSFVFDDIEVTKKDNKILINGNLGIQLENTGDSNIEIKGSLLNLSSNMITIKPKQYLALNIKFNNSQLVPNIFLKDNVFFLAYKYTNVTTNIDVNGAITTKKMDSINPLGIIRNINVILNGISNNNYYSKDVQQIYNNYLSSLSTDTIKNQMNRQTQEIINFVKESSTNISQLFSLLSSNPTLGQFLISVGSIINSTIESFGISNQLLSAITGLFSKETAGTYISNNLNKFREIISLGYKIFQEYHQISSNNATSTNTKHNSIENNNDLDLKNKFLKILKDYSNTKNCQTFINWLINSVEGIMLNSSSGIFAEKSFLEILSDIVPPVLNDLVTSLKQIDSNNFVYQFISSINTLLQGLIHNEKNSTKSLYNLNLFDLLNNKDDNQLITNFLNNGLKQFLEKIIPNNMNYYNKVISIVSYIFTTFQNDKITNIQDIFSIFNSFTLTTNNKKETINLSQLINDYLNIDVKISNVQYNESKHTLSFNNEIKFSFKNDITWNLEKLKTTLGNLKISDILGLVKLITNQDITSKIPPIVNSTLGLNNIFKETISKLLPSNITFKKGDGINIILTARNTNILVTNKNNHLTWYAPCNMIVNLNLKNSLNPIINNLYSSVVNDYITPQLNWIEKFVIPSALNSQRDTIVNFIDNYISGTFGYDATWVNVMDINKSPSSITIQNNVENSNYKLITNLNTKENLIKIIQILNNNNNLSNLNSIDKTINYKYNQTNNNDLNKELFKLLFTDDTNKWLNSKTIPYDVIISKVPKESLTFSLLGITKTIVVPGYYKITIKFPTKILMSTNQRQSFAMSDTYTYKIPS